MDRRSNGTNPGSSSGCNPGTSAGDSKPYKSQPPPTIRVQPPTPPAPALTRSPRGWCLAAQLPPVAPTTTLDHASSSSLAAGPGPSQGHAVTQNDGVGATAQPTKVRLLEYLTGDDGRTYFTGQQRDMTVVDPASGEHIAVTGMYDQRWNAPSRHGEKGKEDKEDTGCAGRLRGGATGDCCREPCGCFGYWCGQICD
ncbi:hypothetical protein Hte_009879 [Hypoxylon texense]